MRGPSAAWARWRGPRGPRRCRSRCGGGWCPSAAPCSATAATPPSATAPAPRRASRDTAQYPDLSDYYKFILVTIMILVSLTELIRLYLGYVGNLLEKVPELAGFWLLTLLPQLPVILFLLFNEGLKIHSLERAVHIVFAAFLAFQVVAAFFTLKRMVNALATRFRLTEFHRLEEQRPGPGISSLGARSSSWGW
ncbi:transmembrane protein 17 isoform X2 [Malurus melanocephalus]|uniref:transmembrane protein 17 isoform X2 n=1 Tax=Malurus melanocephalus TaxID=175006 RepID=UPI002548F313|nr:transmembrane protein 17 isoform X2 [Malurus melanocephalus]